MASLLAQQRLGTSCSRSQSTSSSAASVVGRKAAVSRPHRPQQLLIQCGAATDQQSGDMKTVVQKMTPGDVPFPWSEKDPFRLPVSIDRVQKMLITLGWEKPWVEQIVDRVMKGMLKTTEERAQGVINFLTSIGLKQDEICNMASISVVLLGLNPETRLKTVADYIKSRGVSDGSVADLVLRHPRIFEYKVTPEGKYLVKGAARIQVDALPMPDGSSAVAVNYFRENTSFMASPVSPAPPSA
ncbi:mitochondrial transcription termination factor [Scenedesmus sp. NREL 46B-D3]|nr:mitochondrial transcription termination factor [Scenedesmus sp. NREL 46B-D3]